MTEKMSAQAMARSLTGFDEIAIRRAFGATFDQLEGMFAGRSLAFVQARREGAKDAEAYRLSMEATIGEVTDMFESAEDAEGNSHGSASLSDQTTS